MTDPDAELVARIAVRYSYANGGTVAEMRESFRADPLYEVGDAKLIWANEGDLSLLPMARQLLTDRIAALSAEVAALKAEREAHLVWLQDHARRCDDTFKATGDHGVGCARESYRAAIRALKGAEQ